MEAVEVLMLVAALFCLAAVLRRSIRLARAQTTLHQIVDAAAAHRTLNEKASAFSNRPTGIFPVALAGPRRARNENITTVDYGAHWRALRCNLTAKILHPSRLGSLAPMQWEATRELVASLSAQSLAGGGELAVREPVNAAVFGLVTQLCFGDGGVDARRVREMETVIQEFVIGVGDLNPVFDGSMWSTMVNWRRLRQLFGFFRRQTELFLPLIEARRQPGSRPCAGVGAVAADPYLDSLLDLRVPNGDAGGDHGDVRRALTDNELVSLVSEFLGAGTGSVVACVEWTLAHLVEKPEVQNKLRREIDGEMDDGGTGTVSTKTLRGMPYLNAVVLESLRMHPPVPFILRGVHGVGAAAAIGAKSVPADGLRVQYNAGKIGRDSKTWTDPDEFRPERFLAGGEAEGIGPTPGPKEIRMMPFGAAHRHCPGTSQAMVHVKCFLAALVREFEWAPSAEDCGTGGIDMTELDGFFKVMKKPLSVRVVRRRTETVSRP